MSSGMITIDHGALRERTFAIFAAAGCDAREARIVSDHLVDSNLAGHDSHGVIRVLKYIDWMAADQVRPNQHAQVAIDAGGIIAVNGGYGFGQVVALEAIELGIARAKDTGIALVAVRETGHLGRIGHFAEIAAAAGLASLHFVNTTGFGILVAPFGGTDRRLSANPIAAGFPAPYGAPIIMDFATSIIAEGKISVARNKGLDLPEGAVLDGQGRPTRDAEAFYGTPPGAILPFGAHKGSGLSVVSEILAGSLTGGGASAAGADRSARLVNNMMSILIDPTRLTEMDTFTSDVEGLVTWVTGSPPVEKGGRIYLPGDVERETRAARIADGVPLDANTVAQIDEAAQKVGLVGSSLGQ